MKEKYDVYSLDYEVELYIMCKFVEFLNENDEIMKLVQSGIGKLYNMRKDFGM